MFVTHVAPQTGGLSAIPALISAARRLTGSLSLGDRPLTLPDVLRVAVTDVPVSLSKKGRRRVEDARSCLMTAIDQAYEEGTPIYGITTGFGSLCDQNIDRSELGTHQMNLVRSHSAGVGPILAPHFVRAMMLLRAQTFVQGHSGVRGKVTRQSGQ